MNNLILLFIFTSLFITTANSQNPIFKPTLMEYEIDSLKKIQILSSLDILFSQIKRGKVDSSIIYKEHPELSISIFNSFSGIEANKVNSIPDFYKRQVINFYSISPDKYWMSLAFIGCQNKEEPILRAIVNLIAINKNGHITFSIPTGYLTKTWKTKTIGNISYFFSNKINMERAIRFDQKNTSIANKLDLKADKLQFYLCSNYQEILKLLGYEYDEESKGITRDGYGVEAKTIFSIKNNEDFSHDIFHHYAAKIRGDMNRNRTVEEGLAYSWGNAYYTKLNGEMIEQKELVQELKNYLQKNPETDLLKLFKEDTKIFINLPPEISVKSTISSLLCDEVERKEGHEGIKTLIKCGPGDDDFFKNLNLLISINQLNFNEKLGKLLALYK